MKTIFGWICLVCIGYLLLFFGIIVVGSMVEMAVKGTAENLSVLAFFRSGPWAVRLWVGVVLALFVGMICGGVEEVAWL